LTKEEGNPFAEYFVVLPDSASADVGDTMKAIIFCATPPDCKVTLDFNEQNNLIPSSNLTNQIKDNYAYVVYKLNKKGIYNTAVTLQIYNGTIRESKTFYKKFSFVVN